MEHVGTSLEAIERALVALRRRQIRRTIAGPMATATYEVVDAVEAAEEAGAPPTVTDIASALHVDQPRASRVVASAVEAGFIRREAHPTDGRRAYLVRTRRGRRVSEVMHKERQDTFAGAMEGWSASEQATFARLLTQFVAALGARASNPGGRK
jgi:DNA-binding MarR family transcriptional regulator